MISPTSLYRVFQKPPFGLVLDAAEERALVLQAKAGDPRAMRLLLLASARVILGAACLYRERALTAGIEVDDLISEAVLDFPSAVEAHSLERGARLSSFLYTRIKMKSLTHIHNSTSAIYVPWGKKSHPATIQAAENAFNPIPLDGLESIGEPAIVDSETNAQEGELAPELSRVVRAAVRALPLRQRQVVTLFYGFKGEVASRRQVAQQLGVKTTTISTQNKSAQANLRKALQDKIPLRARAA